MDVDVARRTCRASVPGCCSSFTVLPPAVFCPRPSCQVRFPPVRRLSWCLKSSGRALYSTAGLQKLKLDAAGEIKAQGIMVWQLDVPVTTKNVERKKKEAHFPQKAPSFCTVSTKGRVEPTCAPCHSGMISSHYQIPACTCSVDSEQPPGSVVRYLCLDKLLCNSSKPC